MTAGRAPGDGDLERGYRRLLRWYPRAYRIERGTELVTTLLDTAPPGQRRPSRRDVADLALGGLRQRFRLPIGIGLRFVAVGVALAAGALGATAAAWAVWHTSPGLPADPEVRQVIGTVMGLPYDAPLHRSTGAFGGPLPNAGNGSPAYVGTAQSPRLAGSTMDVVAARLVATGWSIRSVADVPAPAGIGDDGPELSAVRAGVVVWVRWMDDPAHAEAPGTFLEVELVQEDPGLLPAALVAGWLAGAVGGWLLTAATAYRIRRHGTTVQVIAGLLTIEALTTLLLPSVVVYALLQPFRPVSRYPVAPWLGYLERPLGWLTLLAFGAVVVVVALSVIPPGQVRLRSRNPVVGGHTVD